MNIFSHGRNAGPFFCFLQVRIICIICGFFGGYVKSTAGRVGCAFRGGVVYWRGGVFGRGVDQQGFAGVDIEQGGGANGGTFGKAAAGACLVQRLAANTEGGGALGGAGVACRDAVNKGLHGAGLVVNPARGRVVVSGGSAAVQYRLTLCQFVVDANKQGQSVFSIAL